MLKRGKKTIELLEGKTTIFVMKNIMMELMAEENIGKLEDITIKLCKIKQKSLMITSVNCGATLGDLIYRCLEYSKQKEGIEAPKKIHE